jgi:hypothetical protein
MKKISLRDALIRSLVKESLDTAQDENGYDMINMSAREITIDLLTYDYVLEKYNEETLLPHVEWWLNSRKSQQCSNVPTAVSKARTSE